MTFWEKLNQWYGDEAGKFQSIPFIRAVFEGKLTREGYKTFLKSYYPFVAAAAPLYAHAASKIPPAFPRVREWFFKSAYKEMGHDEFIVNDLTALGIQAADTKASRPVPEIDALVSYNYAFLDRHHPVGILGTPFLMGKLSTAYSLGAAQKLKDALGLGEEGISFFFAHGHLDKEQPEDVSLVIQSITDAAIQEDIFLNARAVFMLYQNYFRTLQA